MSPPITVGRRSFLRAGIVAAGALVAPDVAVAESALVDPYIGAIPLVFPLVAGTYQTPLGNNWHAAREGRLYPWNHRATATLRAHYGVDVYPLDDRPLPSAYAPVRRRSPPSACSGQHGGRPITYKVSGTTPPPWDYSQAVDDVAQLPLYGNFVWLRSTDPASAGYFVFFCHLQNERTLRSLAPDQPVGPATPVGVVGDTGNAAGTPQLHVEIHYPTGETFTCASCTPVKAGQTMLDPYASLKEASPRIAGPEAATVPAELRGAARGTLPGNSGGAFAYYQVGNPSGAVTLTLAYAPFDAVWAHGIGFNVNQGGAKLGSATGHSTELGDPENDAAAGLSVSSSAHAGPQLVQVFNYGPAAVSYTLSLS